MTAQPESEKQEQWTDWIVAVALWPLFVVPVLLMRRPLHWRRVIVTTLLWVGVGVWVWMWWRYRP